jgi:hypothetical protein
VNVSRINALCGCLLAWNVLFAMSWIGLPESRAVTKASNAHGHVEDADQRWQLMSRDIDADLSGVRPYYPAVIALAGVNAVLAIAILATITRSYPPLLTGPKSN